MRRRTKALVLGIGTRLRRQNWHGGAPLHVAAGLFARLPYAVAIVDSLRVRRACVAGPPTW
jgi:hypothetical protein